MDEIISPAQAQLLDRIRALLRKEHRRMLIPVIMFVCFGLFFAATLYFAFDPEESLWLQFGLMGGLIVMCSWGAVMMAMTRKQLDPENSPLLDAIQTHNMNQYICWVYARRHNNNGAISYSIQVRTDQKKGYGFTIKEHEYEEFIAEMSAVVSNAVYGYSKEKLADYKKSPRDFLDKYLR